MTRSVARDLHLPAVALYQHGLSEVSYAVRQRVTVLIRDSVTARVRVCVWTPIVNACCAVADALGHP